MATYHSLCWFVTVLVLCMKPHTASSETVYIVASTSDPCPGEQCLTLEEYAANSSQIQSENVRLIVASGTHNLTSVLNVFNVSMFTMSAFTNDATVTCISNEAKVILEMVASVNISGITFQECENSAMEMINVLNATLKQSRFLFNVILAQGEGGGALYSVSSSITIKECVFDSNREGTGASEGGGAIYAQQSSVAILNSTFTNNRANPGVNRLTADGGAINMQQSSVAILNSTFTNNFASHGGGAVHIDVENMDAISTIYVTGNTFTGNTANLFGGAMYIQIEGRSPTTMHITENTFADNVGDNSGGSVAMVIRTDLPDVTLNIAKNAFFTSSATFNGGALTIRLSNNFVTIAENRFMNNTCVFNGGALYTVLRNSSVDIIENTFLYNNVMFSGGGYDVRLRDNSHANITRNTFIGNRCTAGTSAEGAGLYTELSSGSANITKNLFYENTAQRDGGGFYMYSRLEDSTFMSITENNFMNNQAGRYGGALYTELINDGVADINNNQFMNNQAGQDGGALYTELENGVFANINTNVFMNNQADDNGGALFIAEAQNGFITILENFFTNNTSIEHDGGALYSNSITNSSVNIGCSSFINNKGGGDLGGALYMGLTNSSLNISCSLFTSDVPANFSGDVNIQGLNSLVNIASVVSPNLEFRANSNIAITPNNLPDSYCSLALEVDVYDSLLQTVPALPDCFTILTEEETTASLATLSSDGTPETVTTTESSNTDGEISSDIMLAPVYAIAGLALVIAIVSISVSIFLAALLVWVCWFRKQDNKVKETVESSAQENEYKSPVFEGSEEQ